MRYILAFVLLILPISSFAQSEEIVLGLSRDEVAITATFDGSDVLIFGAIKREAPAPDTGPLQVNHHPCRPANTRYRVAQRTGIRHLGKHRRRRGGLSTVVLCNCHIRATC